MRYVPDFVRTAPQSELSKRLHGERKVYDHHPFCSGDRRKPIGTPGCACLRWLRDPNNPYL